MSLQPIEPGGMLARTPAGADPWDRWLGLFRSESTKKAYRADVEEWARWVSSAGIDPLHPRPGDVTAFVEHLRALGRAESTLARKVAALSSFYDWAREEGITDTRPIPRRRPKPGPAPVELGLSVEQVRHVLEIAGSGRYGSRRLRAFVALLVFTGLRVSEALSLDVGDVREQRGHRTVTVTGKGGKRRTVPIVPQCWRELLDYFGARHPDAPMFTTDSGRRWQRREAGESVRRLGIRAGVPLHPHLFRHTAATLMLDAGEPLDRVQDALGHADPATTKRYAQARDNLDKSPVYGLARILTERG